MKYIIIALVCTLSGCASVEYHPPIEMPQEEVAEMTTTDKHGVKSDIGVKQISDCYYRDIGFSQNCSQIICKKDDTRPTKLNCLIYHPTDIPLKEVPKK